MIFLITIYALSFAVEGRRRAANRLARYVIFGAFILALIPLVSLLAEVTSRGLSRFDLDFFTMSLGLPTTHTLRRLHRTHRATGRYRQRLS